MSAPRSTSQSTPRFAPGDRVRIDDRDEALHHRTPAYVKGRTGVVTRVCLDQPRPEDAAYATLDGPRVVVYRVRLNQGELWDGYGGSADDSLDIEMHDHWLSPA